MFAPLEDQKRRDQRKARFMAETTGTALLEAPLEANEPFRGVVVGTCSVVEKEYLRLTAAPDPANVRPLGVLKKALKKVKSEWLANHDYKYALSQLKSIRQDITVQHLKGKFVVEVYETHGRVAIEEADLGELRQCLSQLELLYAAGHEGNKYEFWAYKLLDGLITARGGHHNVDFVCFLQRLNMGQARENPCVQHAQAVRVALVENNYVRFFQLWRSAPRMSGFLLDLLVDPLRKRAFRCMLTVYRPSLPLTMVREQLGFTEMTECRNFLKEQGVVMLSPTVLDMKLSFESFLTRASEAQQAALESQQPSTQPPQTQAIFHQTIKKKKMKRKSLAACEDGPVLLPKETSLPSTIFKAAPPVITVSSDDDSNDSEAQQQLKKIKKKIKRKKPKLKAELTAVKQQLKLVKSALETTKGNSRLCKTLRKEILKLKKQKLQIKIALQSVKSALTDVS